MNLTKFFDKGFNKTSELIDKGFNKASELIDKGINNLKTASNPNSDNGINTANSDETSSKPYYTEKPKNAPLVYVNPMNYYQGPLQFDLEKYAKACGFQEFKAYNPQMQETEDDNIMLYAFYTSNYEWDVLVSSGLITLMRTKGDTNERFGKEYYTITANQTMMFPARFIFVNARGTAYTKQTLTALLQVMKNLIEDIDNKEPFRDITDFEVKISNEELY